MKQIRFSIKTTKHYSSLHILPMNREINPVHVQKMIKSIRSIGIIRPIVTCLTAEVDGIKRRFIIDGQHLATALEREGMEIPYVTIDVTDEIDIVHKMALLNNSSKSWALLDYVNAFKNYKADYNKLFKWKNLYNIEPLMLASIGMNRPVNIAAASKTIKQGEFIITNPNAEEMCKAFNELFIAIGSADRWIKKQFLDIFIISYKSYDHNKTVANINKNISKIKAMSDSTHAKSFIQKKIF